MLNAWVYSIASTVIISLISLIGIIGLSISIEQLKKIIKFKPTAIAFEDSKLISTGKSITQYNPESIRKFIKTIKHTSIIPICGAGISTPVDVKEAYKLGCKGVLIASALANSKNPCKLLTT